jgi:hypothetical protein
MQLFRVLFLVFLSFLTTVEGFEKLGSPKPSTCSPLGYECTCGASSVLRVRALHLQPVSRFHWAAVQGTLQSDVVPVRHVHRLVTFGDAGTAFKHHSCA